MRKPVVLLIKSRSLVSKIIASMPPLGILYIAAHLRQRLGAGVRVVDAALEPDAIEAVRSALRELKPDVVGISSLTAESFLAHRIAAAVKAESPDTPVVMGGPHPSSDPAGALADANVDAAVIGEGKETFTELVRVIAEEGPRWREPGTLRGVAGLAFRAEGKAEYTAPRAPIQDLDSLPFPAWDLIDYKKFWKTWGMASLPARPYLPIFTSRGCPYQCVFCHQIFGKSFRPRSSGNVAEEVAMIHRLGAKSIEVVDDISNFDPDRFDRMLELMLERNLQSVLSFPNAVRADLLRESSVDLLKRVGVGEVSVAVETASGRLQKLLKKNLSLAKVSRAIDMLADRRIYTRGFFMLGLPTETAAEMRATIRFAYASRLHTALFFSPNPFRNTEMHNMYAKAGKLRSEADPISSEYFGAPFNASAVSDRTYRMLYRWAYYSFYLNPARAYRIVRDGPPGWDIPARVFNLFRSYTSFRRLKESC